MMSDALRQYRARIDQKLDRFLTRTDFPPQLLEAMRYAVFNGGKRIRPTLVYLATEALGKPLSQADSTACAVEFIHAYSLIHDDLPAMDDDDLRRGKPTCHIQFNEATAILAGDALQALAFETIAADETIPVHIRLALIQHFAAAAGGSGMVGGQAIDLASEQIEIDAKTLEHMHRRKTGDLIAASVVAGALLANAAPDITRALADFGYALGLAFQIKDDILDEIGNTEVIGKRAGSDASLRKSTFVSVHGLNEATAQLDDQRLVAVAALAPLGAQGAGLVAMAEFVTNRDH